MRARVGDRLVAGTGAADRACEIIGLHHPDGSPPYVVRWFSDGHISLVFPGPFYRLVAGERGAADGQGVASGQRQDAARAPGAAPAPAVTRSGRSEPGPRG